MVALGLLVSLPSALRIFTDDRGRTLVERGLDGVPARTRSAITMLAVYGFFQLVMWLGAIAPTWPVGLYATPMPKLPAHIVNDICDAPGITGTRYGACPGSPGYRMPGRHSRPGRSP
jgi:hypothetical protein